MSTGIWIAIAVVWLISIVVVWGWMRAAALGDRKTRECSEFDKNWLEPRK